ncbi:hypothetical protein AB7G19_29865 [Bradyrhizobium sp. 215_C5_N1_1]|uniref:hypothetical protein n=1 Tax=unclassified Bradyrhizobium TaxID=2631580 RepID=UPI003F8987EB
MSSTDSDNVLERRLLLELKEIETKIGLLTQEKATLERLLLTVRRRNPLTMRTDVTRKNSVRRVLVESVVVENLRNSKSGSRKTHELLREMQIVDPQMNPSTFRSTLHRMKARGIVANPRDGAWELTRAQS